MTPFDQRVERERNLATSPEDLEVRILETQEDMLKEEEYREKVNRVYKPNYVTELKHWISWFLFFVTFFYFAARPLDKTYLEFVSDYKNILYALYILGCMSMVSIWFFVEFIKYNYMFPKQQDLHKKRFLTKLIKGDYIVGKKVLSIIFLLLASATVIYFAEKVSPLLFFVIYLVYLVSMLAYIVVWIYKNVQRTKEPKISESASKLEKEITKFTKLEVKEVLQSALVITAIFLIGASLLCLSIYHRKKYFLESLPECLNLIY